MFEDNAMSDSTALAVISASAISTIIAADKEDILGKFAEKVNGFKSDASTHDGREKIRTMAAETRRTKASLLRLSKGLKEESQKTLKAIIAEEHVIEDRMNELWEALRGPLTAWEDREKNRVSAHEGALGAIAEAPGFYDGHGEVEDYQRRLDWLLAYPAREWEEFAQRASDALMVETTNCRRALGIAEKRRAEAVELERLRAAETERQRLEAARLQAEREAGIAAEAAKAARLAAEAETARLLHAAEERAAEAAAQIERDRQAEEDRAAEALAEAQRARAAAEANAERDRLAAAAREEAQRLRAEAAEQQAKAAQERAERDSAEAVDRERRRAAEEKAAQEREEARRAADKEHKATINRESMTDLMATGLDEKTARAAITAIAQQKVRHVRIVY